jgi:predicted dehydrogenase
LGQLLSTVEDADVHHEPVRIGLIGFGKSGRYFHAPVILRADGCELAGVVVRSGQRRADLAEDHPGIPAYGNLRELSDAGIDAVVICTPLDSHVTLVHEAIDRKLAVVCEKPLAADAVAARDAVLHAERVGVLLTVYQNRRWDADFLTVEQVLASGALGPIIEFESRMERRPPATGFSTTGGGVLLDFGSHLVDQAVQLFGPVTSVYAEIDAVSNDGPDYRFFTALRHAGGVTSHLNGNWAVHDAPSPRFRVLGRTGSFQIPEDDGQSERLLGHQKRHSGAGGWRSVPRRRWGRMIQGSARTAVRPSPGSWTSFYGGLADALRGTAPPPVDPWDAVAVLRVIDAARLSSTTREVVKLEPGRPRLGAC